MPARILVISPDESLRSSRTALLLHEGYEAVAANGVAKALTLLSDGSFDLAVIGGRSQEGDSVAQTLRMSFPDLLILKIGGPFDDQSAYVSRTTDSNPQTVVIAVCEMLAATESGAEITAEKPEKSRYTGEVKWFNNAKGFGLLARSDGPDVFVHYSAIQNGGSKSLQEGDSVEFDIVQSEEGPQAVKVIRTKATRR